MKEVIDISNVIMCSNDELVNSEAVELRCSVRKVFSEISQNSQENTCARVSFFNKVAGLGLELPVNFAKFLRTLFYRTPPGDCCCPVSYPEAGIIASKKVIKRNFPQKS